MISPDKKVIHIKIVCLHCSMLVLFMPTPLNQALLSQRLHRSAVSKKTNKFPNMSNAQG